MATHLKLIICKTVIFLSVTLLANLAHAESTWNGTYRYKTTMGNTVASNMPIVRIYKLTIDDTDCTLSIDGYQTMESIECKTEIAKQRIRINFKSYDNGEILNIYGDQAYKPGRTMLELRKSGKRLITVWLAEKPDNKLPRTGEYFKKDKKDR